jgi:hypothetical protein
MPSFCPDRLLEYKSLPTEKPVRSLEWKADINVRPLELQETVHCPCGLTEGPFPWSLGEGLNSLLFLILPRIASHFFNDATQISLKPFPLGWACSPVVACLA